MATSRKPWLRPLLTGFLVFVLIVASVSFILLSRWNDVQDAQPPAAELAFAAALVESGGEPAYIEFLATGEVVLHHELEAENPRRFAKLKVLIWSAADQKLVRAEYPHWFVKLKTASALNLGTMISVVRREWSDLDLSISYHDLTQRGPGLLLDHRQASGSRIMIWTVSSTPTPARAAGPVATKRILVTSAAGARVEPQENIAFTEGTATGKNSGTVITIWPDSTKQTIHGIGTSFTESSAFVLAHLEKEKRLEVMRKIYSEEGANFSLTRTHIASCDFSVEGKYAYAEQADDPELTAFTIAPDVAGFDPAVYPGVKDPDYDLLPMIQEALAIKAEQEDSELKIIASAWTAPPWMKDIETWFIPGAEENGWQGSAGSLKPQYEATYADYLVKYLDAYAAAGVDVWGLTPVNEPHGNGGHWESMNFSPESQSAFIKNHLGPRLENSDHAAARLLIYDQNRDGVEPWADVIYGDAATAPFVFGMAVHWYASTFKVYEESFDRIHASYPGFEIIHTEGCIDNLGGAAPGGVADPAGFQESGWFQNDAFWWNKTATDWAYSVDWAGVIADDHPMYTPVHRYARNIIVSLDHWVTGWVDWNIVLDREGGPNHVNNFCGAPIMIDTATGDIHYTPVFHVLAQFSRTIRPGDQAVWTRLEVGEGLEDGQIYACATRNKAGLVSVQVLNTAPEALPYKLQIGGIFAEITVPANSVQTLQVQL